MSTTTTSQQQREQQQRGPPQLIFDDGSRIMMAMAEEDVEAQSNLEEDDTNTSSSNNKPTLRGTIPLYIYYEIERISYEIIQKLVVVLLVDSSSSSSSSLSSSSSSSSSSSTENGNGNEQQETKTTRTTTAPDSKDTKILRIALQFPDELLIDSPDVCWLLEDQMKHDISKAIALAATTTTTTTIDQQSQQQQNIVHVLPFCFVLGDTTVNSCCPDEVAAYHLNANLLVHYGHACLSPTSALPIIYSFGRCEFNIENAITEFDIAIERRRRRRNKQRQQQKQQQNDESSSENKSSKKSKNNNNNNKFLILYQVGYHHAMKELQNQWMMKVHSNEGGDNDDDDSSSFLVVSAEIPVPSQQQKQSMKRSRLTTKNNNNQSSSSSSSCCRSQSNGTPPEPTCCQSDTDTDTTTITTTNDGGGGGCCSGNKNSNNDCSSSNDPLFSDVAVAATVSENENENSTSDDEHDEHDDDNHDCENYNDSSTTTSSSSSSLVLGGLVLPSKYFKTWNDIKKYTIIFIMANPKKDMDYCLDDTTTPQQRQYANTMLCLLSLPDSSENNTHWVYSPDTTDTDTTTNQTLMVDVQPSSSVQRQLNRRYYLIQKAKDSQTFGILVSNLSQQYLVDVVNSIQKLLEQSDKSSYTFAVGKINPNKLANFAEIDIFVLVACQENSLLDKERNEYGATPVITPYELQIALGIKEWGGCASDSNNSSKQEIYSLNCQDIIINNDNAGNGNGRDDDKEEQQHQDGNDNNHRNNNNDDDNINDDSDAPYFSMITGKYVSSRKNTTKSNLDLINLPGKGQVMEYNSKASEFLKTREYQGLKSDIGKTEIEIATKGLTGIASDYSK